MLTPLTAVFAIRETHILTVRMGGLLLLLILLLLELRLMFSPALGMFIAPGCNGLRGAIAMGYLALIVGYLYGLRIWLHAVYVVAAVLLAYLLNLVRLCSLVLCYKVALGFPFLARHMEAADYLLGSLIFFSAAVFVFALPRRWTNNRPLSLRSLHLQQ